MRDENKYNTIQDAYRGRGTHSFITSAPDDDNE
jgi:hypothetical protein